MTPYAYEHTGRNRATLITLLGVWALMGGAAIWMQASPVLLALAALATLPALYDLITGRVSGVRLDTDGLTWFAGRRSGDVPWEAITHIRLDTRLDFSVRASAVLASGAKLRLPIEATPPADTFEAVLKARGIAVERHHFSLLG